MSAKVNAVGASLKVNVTVPVVCAWLMKVLSIDSETVGVSVSTVKAAVLPPAPAKSKRLAERQRAANIDRGIIQR